MIENWHALPLTDIFSRLNSSASGLSQQEAGLRLAKSGRNILPQEKPYSKLRLFLSQFNSSLIYIMLSTVLISFLLRHYSDAIFIFVVLLINILVGFFQENKANRSLLALRKMVRIRVRVLRDELEKEIDSEELAPGDVVFLKAGDKVPADGRVIEARNLKINEASLTGESRGVGKAAGEIVAGSAPISERKNAVFMGTIVEGGWGSVIIVDTGIGTQLGAVVTLLKETREPETPFQKKISSLSKLTGAFVILVILAIIITGYFTGKSFVDIFISAMALTVSAIPEGLLPAITVILALGMRRILKQKGLVRKLSATETLGSVTVICTDKTGTLTEGEMKVSHILTTTRELMSDDISGLAKGENSNGVESHISALKIATLANDAFVENPDAELQEWIVRGRSTERALLLAGMQSGLNKLELEKQYVLLDRISFESEHKFAATFHRRGDGQHVLFAVGAPEEIIARCVSLDVDGHKERIGFAEESKLISKMEALTQKGLRVVACAHREYDAGVEYGSLMEMVSDLSLVGFIAIKDPLRPDAKESVLTTKKAGIRTIIVTGDHKLTAKAIAEEIGLAAGEENIVEGKELDAISDEDLKEKIKYVTIFARVLPSHKLRIVKALQADGEVVAMFGDGVNDAPALKAADIGVVVGSGTDVAKEVADLVLLDDNFKTVIKAIEQGRVITGNIRKVFVYLVADDFSELFLFLVCMIMGLPLPLLAAQILWINLVEDGFPDIALTTEQETEGVMEEPPRDPKEPILNRPLKLWMTAIFFITGLAAFLTFLFLLRSTGGDLERSRTIVFAIMCVDSLLFSLSVRSFKRTIFRRDIFSNRYLFWAIILSAGFLFGAIYFPFLQKLLSTQALGAADWVLIFGVSLIEISLIEIFKKLIFSKPPVAAIPEKAAGV